VLTDPQKRRYARQILVEELGLAGQERLSAASVRAPETADRGAAAVALDYLSRAGLHCEGGSLPLTAADELEAKFAGPGSLAAVGGELTQPDSRGERTTLDVATPQAVRALAGDEALAECAAWLAGAFAAVETIKRVARIGVEGRLDPELTLSEVRRAAPDLTTEEVP
jgi:hypothetical protein